MSYGSDHTATVTDPFGNTRDYDFSLVHGDFRQTVKREPADQYNNNQYTEQRSFDTNGFPDLITQPDGTVTDLDYNARGLEDYRIEALGLAEERHIDTDWHPKIGDTHQKNPSCMPPFGGCPTLPLQIGPTIALRKSG